MTLASRIEAILFWKGEPVSLKKLGEILEVPKEQIRDALEGLDESLKDRGITLVRKDDEVMLGTSSQMSSLIEKLTKEELMRDLGKAGLETLSIILYKGPIKRSEIDYIRGVNSAFIIRNLLVRGLVERISDPEDQRGYLYRTTFELMTHLGVSKIQDLPEYSIVREELLNFVTSGEQSKTDNHEDSAENQ